MKMSSPERRRFESRSVAQHRPQDVDPSSGERDEGLGVPLALLPLAIVEGSGVRRATQAGESRQEEDALEDLVASTHPAVVAHPLAGVASGRDQTGVGGELVGAREGRKITDGHKKLGPEDRTDAGQAREYPDLGAFEKTARYLPIHAGQALLEGEDLIGALDAAPLEMGGQTLASRPADLRRSLVAGEEDQRAFGAQVQGALEGREKRHKRLSEAGYGASLVDYEVAPASEEEPQLGEGALLGSEFGEIPSHASLLGDEAGIPPVGLGLPAVGVAGAVDDQAGNVENPLPPLPQQRQQERRAPTGLVDGPHEFSRKRERLVDELEEVGLVVFDPARKHLVARARSVERVSPVELLAGIDADPGFVHEDLLHHSLAFEPSPTERPADGSLCSESPISPISISGRGLPVRDRGAIPFEPSNGGDKIAILGPLGRRSGTVPEQPT